MKTNFTRTASVLLVLFMFIAGLAVSQNRPENQRPPRLPNSRFFRRGKTLPFSGMHTPAQYGNPATMKKVKADIQDSSNVSMVGRWSNGSCVAVAVDSNYVYFDDDAAYGKGAYLRIALLHDTNEIDLSSSYIPTFVEYIAVQGQYVYVVEEGLYDSYEDGLRIIDVSNPANPNEVGYYNTASNGGSVVFGVAVSGNYAYMAGGSDGLRIIDVSNPSSPKEVGFYDTGGFTRGVAVSGNYAYVADNEDGLRIIDVSNPANPNEVGYYNTGGYAGQTHHYFLGL